MKAHLRVFFAFEVYLFLVKMQYIRSIVSCVLLVSIGLLFVGKSKSTPLDDYVRTADPNFGWIVIRTYEQPDYILYILNFTSQKWLDGRLFVFLYNEYYSI